MQKFYLESGGGAMATISEVIKISPERCRRSGAKCAVILAEIKTGILRDGDEIVLKGGSGELCRDTIGRLEVNRQQYAEAGPDVAVGILLMQNTSRKIAGFGIPLHHRNHVCAIHP